MQTVPTVVILGLRILNRRKNVIKTKEDLINRYAVREDKEVFEMFMQKCEEFGLKFQNGQAPRVIKCNECVCYNFHVNGKLGHGSNRFFNSQGMRKLTLADFNTKESDYDRGMREAMKKIALSCGRNFCADIGYEDLPDLVDSLICKPQPKTRTEYKPVTMRDYEALQEFHAGKEFYHKSEYARKYNQVSNVETLIQAHVGGWLYTKEEVKID